MSRTDTLEYNAGPNSPPILFVRPSPVFLREFLRHHRTRDIDCRRQPISPEYILRTLRMWKDNYLPRGQENTGLRHLKSAGSRGRDRAIPEEFITT